MKTFTWRNNEHDGVSNQKCHDCLLNRLFRHRSKKISKLRITGRCEGNSPGIGEFSAQRASNTENVSIWWHHHTAGSVLRPRVVYCQLDSRVIPPWFMAAVSGHEDIITSYLLSRGVLWCPAGPRANGRAVCQLNIDYLGDGTGELMFCMSRDGVDDANMIVLVMSIPSLKQWK